jgi:hypothetical protein
VKILLWFRALLYNRTQKSIMSHHTLPVEVPKPEVKITPEEELAAKRQLEMLAIILFKRSGAVGADAQMEAWRTNEPLRLKWRAEAEDLKDLLLSVGLRVEVSNTRCLTKALDEALTVPAVKAYEL